MTTKPATVSIIQKLRITGANAAIGVKHDHAEQITVDFSAGDHAFLVTMSYEQAVRLHAGLAIVLADYD